MNFYKFVFAVFVFADFVFVKKEALHSAGSRGLGLSP